MAAAGVGAAAQGVGAAASLYSAYKNSRPKPGPLGGPGGAGYQPPQQDRIGSALDAAKAVSDALKKPDTTQVVQTQQQPQPVQQPVPIQPIPQTIQPSTAQPAQLIQPNPLVVGNPATGVRQPWQQQQNPYLGIGGNPTIADSLGYRRY